MVQDLDEAQLHDKRVVELALRVLDECRVSLMMSFRFLDRAMWKMPLVPAQLTKPFAADGRKLYFDPDIVLQMFRLDPRLLIRAYLHSVLHCIFRHPYRTVRVSKELWSACCDICIEIIAVEMCHGRLALETDVLARRLRYQLSQELDALTPASIYKFVLQIGSDSAMQQEHMELFAMINDLSAELEHDSHHLWDLREPPKKSQDQENSGDGPSDQDPGDGDESGEGAEGAQPDQQDGQPSDDFGDEPGDDFGDEQDALDEGGGQDAQPLENDNDADSDDRGGPDRSQDEQGDASDAGQGDSQDYEGEEQGGSPERNQGSSGFAQGGDQGTQHGAYQYSEGDLEEARAALAEQDEDDDSEKEWAEIAKQVETELQTLDQEQGESAGNLMANLALANRSRIDYESFLRRFSTMAEDAKINDDEFDYIFYTYGLKRYGNMPLIEPLEYKETDRLREFVIALDTSGSCSRGLLRIFITRTYEILTSGQSLGENINIHIVQCDAQVQLDTVITSSDELRDYERNFEVHGMGGTDFRPLFAYVDQLVADKEFNDLRGLIYFTDGFGTFPSSPPDYEVAFVFVEEEGKQRRVPPWAMKVVMNEEEIQALDENGVETVF